MLLIPIKMHEHPSTSVRSHVHRRRRPLEQRPTPTLITLHQLRTPDIQFFRSREIAVRFGNVVRLQDTRSSPIWFAFSASASRPQHRGLRAAPVLHTTHLVHLLAQWIPARRNRSANLTNVLFNTPVYWVGAHNLQSYGPLQTNHNRVAN